MDLHGLAYPPGELYFCRLVLQPNRQGVLKKGDRCLLGLATLVIVTPKGQLHMHHLVAIQWLYTPIFPEDHDMAMETAMNDPEHWPVQSTTPMVETTSPKFKWPHFVHKGQPTCPRRDLESPLFIKPGSFFCNPWFSYIYIYIP